MNYLARLVAWVWRAWPLILVAAVALLHLAAYLAVPDHRTFVSKLTGTLLQIAGGLIVLHSLDGNLGLFKQQNLLSVFLRWTQEFPRFRRHSVSMSGVAMVGTFSIAGDLTVGQRTTTTIEERVAELERKLKEESDKLRALEKSTQGRLESLKIELSQTIAAVDNGLRDLADKVESAAIGGLKQQLFGVLLAIYGAVVSIFA
jgi:hypothetical protein